MNRRLLYVAALGLAPISIGACSVDTGPTSTPPIIGTYVLTAANSRPVPATVDSIVRTEPPPQTYWEIMADGHFVVTDDTSGVLDLTYRSFLKVPDVSEPLLAESGMSAVPVRIRRSGATLLLIYTAIHEAICGRGLDALREYTDTATVTGDRLAWRRPALSCWPAMLLDFQRQ